MRNKFILLLAMLLIFDNCFNGFSVQSSKISPHYLVAISDPTGKQSPAYQADFDSELNKLITGMKDKYASLKGTRVEEKPGAYKHWESKVKLNHSESTHIVESASSTYVVADFGEYEAYKDALFIYKTIKLYIENCTKLPCNLAITEDVESDENEMRWVIYEENDDECKKDAALKGFSMKLQLQKAPSVKLMKQNIFKSLFFVSLTIGPA